MASAMLMQRQRVRPLPQGFFRHLSPRRLLPPIVNGRPSPSQAGEGMLVAAGSLGTGPGSLSTTQNLDALLLRVLWLSCGSTTAAHQSLQKVGCLAANRWAEGEKRRTMSRHCHDASS